MSDQKTTRSQKKKPIPNAFEQARNTGTIGGSGQTPELEPTNIDTQKPKHTDTQKTTYVDKQKITNVVIQKDTGTKDEERIQQTMKIKKSLSVRMKVYVAQHHPETISSVMETALEEYLAKRENQ